MKTITIAAAAVLLSGGVSIAMAQQQTNSTTQHIGTAAQQANDAVKINDNQAIATTSASSATPAKGANSYTMSEAKSRLEKSGFSNVGDLTKDNDGIWHGQAQKSGNTTTVWLDYKGNTGETK